MKREICCPKCAESWRQTMDWERRRTRPGEYPGLNSEGEGMRQMVGSVIAISITCDGCGCDMPNGAEALAVSVYSSDRPYFEWESDYLDGCRDQKAATP